MYYQKWCHGCRVTVSDWIGKDESGKIPIRIDIEYFAPGTSTASAPVWEKAIICPRSEEDIIYNRLDSIAYSACIGKI